MEHVTFRFGHPNGALIIQKSGIEAAAHTDCRRPRPRAVARHNVIEHNHDLARPNHQIRECRSVFAHRGTARRHYAPDSSSIHPILWSRRAAPRTAHLHRGTASRATRDPGSKRLPRAAREKRPRLCDIEWMRRLQEECQREVSERARRCPVCRSREQNNAA